MKCNNFFEFSITKKIVDFPKKVIFHNNYIKRYIIYNFKLFDDINFYTNNTYLLNSNKTIK